MVIDMSRRYRINFGRKTVKPFKEHDINNMLVLCKKRRNQAEEDNNKEQQYLWDRNYMILVIGMNLAFRIEDIIQLKVDYFKMVESTLESLRPIKNNHLNYIHHYIKILSIILIEII